MDLAEAHGQATESILEFFLPPQYNMAGGRGSVGHSGWVPKQDQGSESLRDTGWSKMNLELRLG